MPAVFSEKQRRFLEERIREKVAVGVIPGLALQGLPLVKSQAGSSLESLLKSRGSPERPRVEKGGDSPCYSGPVSVPLP